ncbi:hypothetical protein JCM10908_001907 [Rhodotorula pacifica]|uniref:uncharacterized protein n=1 Tax=Rhodotorula pacifica TaxID=1495444 RepID=UPI0031793594
MPKPEPDKIPISTLSDLRHEGDALQAILALNETEDTWEKINRALKRFQAVVRGGATKFTDEFVALLRDPRTAKPLVRSIVTERGALSGTALELIASCTRLGPSFAPLLPLYLPPILRLFGRPNKVYTTRSASTVLSIVKNTRLVEVLRYVVLEWRAEAGKSASFREHAAATVAAMMGTESGTLAVEKELLERRIDELEWVIKTGATGREPSVRSDMKKCWEVYKREWPERVHAFTAPMSPTTRKYLKVDVLSSSSSGPSSTSAAPHHPPPAMAAPSVRRAAAHPPHPSSTAATSSSSQSHAAGPSHSSRPVPGPGPSLARSHGPPSTSISSSSSRSHQAPPPSSASTATAAPPLGMGPPPLRTSTRSLDHVAAGPPTHTRTVSSSTTGSSRSASRSETRGGGGGEVQASSAAHATAAPSAGPVPGRTGFKPTAAHAPTASASRPALATSTSTSSSSRPAGRALLTSSTGTNSNGPANSQQTVVAVEPRKARRVAVMPPPQNAQTASLAPPVPSTAAGVGAGGAVAAPTLARSHSSTASLARSHGTTAGTTTTSAPTPGPTTSAAPTVAAAAAASTTTAATPAVPALSASASSSSSHAHAPFRPTRRPQPAATTTSTASASARIRPGVTPSAATLASRERRAAREREKERKAAEEKRRNGEEDAARREREREREEVRERARKVPLPPPVAAEELEEEEARLLQEDSPPTETAVEKEETPVDIVRPQPIASAAAPVAVTTAEVEAEPPVDVEAPVAAVEEPAPVVEAPSSSDAPALAPAPEQEPKQPVEPAPSSASVPPELESAPQDAPLLGAPTDLEHPAAVVVEEEIHPESQHEEDDGDLVEESVGMDSDYLVESQGTEGDHAPVEHVEPEEEEEQAVAESTPRVREEVEALALVEARTAIDEPVEELAPHIVERSSTLVPFEPETDDAEELDDDSNATVEAVQAVHGADEDSPDHGQQQDELESSAVIDGQAIAAAVEEEENVIEQDEPAQVEQETPAPQVQGMEQGQVQHYDESPPSPLLSSATPAAAAAAEPATEIASSPAQSSSALATPTRVAPQPARPPVFYPSPSPGPVSRYDAPFTPASSVPVRFPLASIPYSPEPFQTRSIILDTPPRFEQFAPVRLPQRGAVPSVVEAAEQRQNEEDELSEEGEASLLQDDGLLDETSYADDHASPTRPAVNVTPQAELEADASPVPRQPPPRFFPDAADVAEESAEVEEDAETTFEDDDAEFVAATEPETSLNHEEQDGEEAEVEAAVDALSVEIDQPLAPPVPSSYDDSGVAATGVNAEDEAEIEDNVDAEDADVTAHEESSALPELAASPVAANPESDAAQYESEQDDDDSLEEKEDAEEAVNAPASPAGTTLDFSDFNAPPSTSTPSTRERRPFWDESLLGDESANFELEQPGLRFHDETESEHSMASTLLGDFDISGRGPILAPASYRRTEQEQPANEEPPSILQRSLRSRVVTVDLSSSTSKTPARSTRAATASGRRDALMELQQ